MISSITIWMLAILVHGTQGTPAELSTRVQPSEQMCNQRYMYATFISPKQYKIWCYSIVKDK